MVIAICVLVYLLIAFCAYNFVVSKWEEYSKFEKIYFSLIWLPILPIYIVQKVHDKL